VGDTTNVDDKAVFEVEDKGRTFYLKNIRSIVSLEGWALASPQIYEAEEAIISQSTVKDATSSSGGSFVELGDNSSSYVEWTIDVPSDGAYLLSFRYALDTSPKRLDIQVNGNLVPQQRANAITEIVDLGWSPPAENFPLPRCTGDCDSDGDCAEGLHCANNDALEPIPGCSGQLVGVGYDYCADVNDFSNVGFLPTGGWTNDWHISKPLEVELTTGSNTIRAQIPDGGTKGPNLDHLVVEGMPKLSSSQFRNPPHFMNLIPDYHGHSASEIGEQTVRDAQYETDAVLDSYFYHDNVGPFLCTRIMQRFSFSNPSRRFVASCVNAFRSGSYTSDSVSFGSGEYGSLEALAASIFLDPEATDSAVIADPSAGSAREPILKVMNLMRSMAYQTSIPTTLDGPPMQTTYSVKLWKIHKAIGQAPYDFPSVFSFYLPEYIADSGPTHSAHLVSPESMLTTMPNIVNTINGLYSLIKYGLSDCGDGFALYPGYGGHCSDDGLYKRSFGHLFYQPAGATLTEQCQELSLLLTAGRLRDDSVDTIVTACATEPDQASQVRCMQQLIVTTSEFHTTNLVNQIGSARAPETNVASTQSPYKAIVYYWLAGGMDSFNMLAPHTCAPIDVYERYRTVRGKSGLSEGIGMPLGRLLEIQALNQPCSSFGVHENLPVLKALYDEGRLNFVANAGLLSKPLNVSTYKDEDWRSKLYSHNGMSLETAKEDLFDGFDGTGVLGRMSDVLTQAGIPTNTFSIHGQTAALTGVAGQGPSQYILDSKGISPFNQDPSLDNMEGVIRNLHNDTAEESGFFAETFSSKLVDILDKQDLLQAALAATTLTTTFPDSSTADEFAMVARLMQTAEARGSNRDIFYVLSGGFDSHSNVDENLVEEFLEMNAALEAFVAELKVLNLWDKVVLVQQSEFGRTLEPNSGGGSDHGWGGNFFMFGGSVDGGKVLGQYPSDFEEGDSAGIMLSRGRVVPTTPWDAVWKGTAEWFGIPATGLGMDKVLPMHKNFPSHLLYGEDDLFDILGPNGGESTS
jgi:uncharacterized protein (DUF1501 family)